MRPDGRNDGRDDLRPGLQETSETGHDTEKGTHERVEDLIFDFTGLRRPELRDLSFILTARLQSEDDDRVYVRALPTGTWDLLQSMGLDHLFWAYPRGSDVQN